jgi:catechol 2,3-dioxygenase-like lactoylglutathione lyase family enzyme
VIDHIGIRVSDLPRSTAFYRAALGPLGYAVLMDFAFGAGLGRDGKPDLWLYPGSAPADPVHVALACPDRATVRAFHTAALAAGAEDTGAPGLRPEYHPHYYGAFVRDPDGYNLEAVCHTPEQPPR